MLPERCQTIARRIRPPSSGETGDQVEQCQEQIDDAEVQKRRLDYREVGGRRKETGDQEAECEEKADDRARCGNAEFSPGIVGILRQLGHTAEHEQRDPPDLDAESLGDQRVAQFVGENGQDEQRRRRGSDQPL